MAHYWLNHDIISLRLSTYYLDLSHFELPKDGSTSNHHQMVLNNAFNGSEKYSNNSNSNFRECSTHKGRNLKRKKIKRENVIEFSCLFCLCLD